MQKARSLREISLDCHSQVANVWLLAEGQTAVSPIVEIHSSRENDHFPSRNPSGTAKTQFAAKCTPKNYLMYHSSCARVEPDAQCKRRGVEGGRCGGVWGEFLGSFFSACESMICRL